MADERGGIYEINRSFANHLVGNVHVIRRLGVANLGNHLASFPSRGLSHKGGLFFASPRMSYERVDLIERCANR